MFRQFPVHQMDQIFNEIEENTDITITETQREQICKSMLMKNRTELKNRSIHDDRMMILREVYRVEKMASVLCESDVVNELNSVETILEHKIESSTI